MFKKLKWDNIECVIMNDDINEGFSLIEGCEPWLYVSSDGDLRLVLTEPWFCENTGNWKFCDIDIKFEDVIVHFLQYEKETGTKNEFIKARNGMSESIKKLLKTIESI